MQFLNAPFYITGLQSFVKLLENSWPRTTKEPLSSDNRIQTGLKTLQLHSSLISCKLCPWHWIKENEGLHSLQFSKLLNHMFLIYSWWNPRQLFPWARCHNVTSLSWETWQINRQLRIVFKRFQIALFGTLYNCSRLTSSVDISASAWPQPGRWHT